MTAVSRSSKPRRDRRTRSARAERRDGRETLLDAALEVFADRGYREASIDEIAARAGYSKGALYWHFSSKDELFSTLLEERLDKPWREGIALLESASADIDMAPEASARFTAMLRGQRELVLLDQEYWSLAVRDPKLRSRYAKRQRELRRALGRAIAARMEELGAPPLDQKPEELAAAFIALGQGLAIQRLIDARAVPDSILGDTLSLIYAGHLARSGRSRENQH